MNRSMTLYKEQNFSLQREVGLFLTSGHIHICICIMDLNKSCNREFI